MVSQIFTPEAFGSGCYRLSLSLASLRDRLSPVAFVSGWGLIGRFLDDWNSWLVSFPIFPAAIR